MGASQSPAGTRRKLSPSQVREVAAALRPTPRQRLPPRPSQPGDSGGGWSPSASVALALPSASSDTARDFENSTSGCTISWIGVSIFGDIGLGPSRRVRVLDNHIRPPAARRGLGSYRIERDGYARVQRDGRKLRVLRVLNGRANRHSSQAVSVANSHGTSAWLTEWPNPSRGIPTNRKERLHPVSRQLVHRLLDLLGSRYLGDGYSSMRRSTRLTARGSAEAALRGVARGVSCMRVPRRCPKLPREGPRSRARCCAPGTSAGPPAASEDVCDEIHSLGARVPRGIRY